MSEAVTVRVNSGQQRRVRAAEEKKRLEAELAAGVDARAKRKAARLAARAERQARRAGAA